LRSEIAANARIICDEEHLDQNLPSERDIAAS
jgi:hypothetical protein